MANLIRWLVEACNPCIHQWTTTATLKDREENPTTVRLVQECDICGATRKQDYATPETNGECKHEWVTGKVIKIYDRNEKDEDIAAGKVIPVMFRHVQQCKRCGDIRKVDI